jgi:hypothetical protein
MRPNCPYIVVLTGRADEGRELQDHRQGWTDLRQYSGGKPVFVEKL